MRSGPTSANSCPARILFVRTPEAKARLIPALSPGNVDKTKAAPVTAIIGYDTRFFEGPPKLFPHRPEMKNPPRGEREAGRGRRVPQRHAPGRLLHARRASDRARRRGHVGFDNAKVDAEFFPDGRIKSNFLCNVGHGDPSKVMAKLPRLEFDEACTLL